jgi:Ankyrin repeat.
MGVRPDIMNDDGDIPLSCAARNGHVAMVELLLARNGVIQTPKIPVDLLGGFIQ